jgi:hypothetical protein
MTPAEQAQNSADLEASQLRINQLRREEAQYARDSSVAGQAEYRRIQDQLRIERTLHAQRREGLVNQQTLNKELASFAKSYVKLSSTVKAQLQTETSLNGQKSVYKALGEQIANSKAREVGLTGDQLELEQERGALMTEINASLLTQAKATAKAIDDAKGLTEFDKMRRELRETMLELSDEERKELERAIDRTEELYKKEERLKIIKEEQKGLFEALPDSVKGALGFAEKLGPAFAAGAGPMLLIASLALATLTSFTALDSAAKEFRTETGLTNSQTADIKKNANEIVGEFGNLGVEAKDVFDTVSALKSEFSDIYDISKQTTAALTVLSANFGVSSENAAKVQGVFERMGGVSGETAANLQLQAAKMAEMAGVAPAKVAQDIADAAGESYKFFKGNVNALTAAAIQARRLGSSLKEVLEVNRKLLDFEGSIEDELVAATFAGGQFNLTQARRLAASKDYIGAEQEILKQIQRSGDFRDADLWTQEALAKGAGMEVEEVIKKLDAQEKLASLSVDERTRADEAIKKGLDITNITEGQLEAEIAKFETQQAQQAVLDQLQNQFTGIAATLGSVLVPLFETIVPIVALIAKPFQWMADGLTVINENLAAAVFFYGALAGYGAFILANKIREKALDMAALATGKQKAAITFREAVSSIFSSLGKIPFGVGLLLAAGVIAGMVGLFSKAGDVMSPADGVTRISTKEGGLFELSPNDDLVAAPGAANALANMNNENGSELASASNGTGATANGDGDGDGDGRGRGRGRNVNVNNLSQLAAPLQAMINEIKGLRADMAAGKIAVYMDTDKVTSTIGRQVDQSTRNNYSLAQA